MTTSTEQTIINTLKAALKLIIGQDQGCGGNVTASEAFASAQRIAKNALLAVEHETVTDSEPLPVSDLEADNRHLRRLLATCVAGATLYRDDGELSDGSVLPVIDFKRDSVKDIERKLALRMMNSYR